MGSEQSERLPLIPPRSVYNGKDLIVAILNHLTLGICALSLACALISYIRCSLPLKLHTFHLSEEREQASKSLTSKQAKLSDFGSASWWYNRFVYLFSFSRSLATMVVRMRLGMLLYEFQAPSRFSHADAREEDGWRYWIFSFFSGGGGGRLKRQSQLGAVEIRIRLCNDWDCAKVNRQPLFFDLDKAADK